MDLLLCTGNPGKVEELRALLPKALRVIGLTEAGLPLDLPENGTTLHDNAFEKARFAHARTGLACLADDTGLEVDALNGAPGVFSARYASDAKDPRANMDRLLRELEGRQDRGARFRTVIAFVSSEEEMAFEGVVEGRILESRRGDGGFGYDPLFVPEGHERTFAEMPLELKNTMSHRARAMGKAVAWLEEHYALG